MTTEMTKSQKLMKRRKAAVANGVGVFNTATVKHAKGAIITDEDGNELIDFAGGIGVVNAGHCPQPVVEAIQQKVKLDVNEKRIVATAVTVVRSGLGSAVGMPNPDEPIDVIADRPFLFFIIDKPTNGIFFMGRYAIPNEADIVVEEE